MTNKTTVIVIGAGLSGCFSALALADKGYNVTLFDFGSEVLPLNSSSINQTYRIHVGPHYLKDPKTGRHCLVNSIETARELSEFIAGGENLSDPLRRGKYFVVEPSLITAEDAEEGFLFLKNAYNELVEKDPKNKVFGEPNEFYRKLAKADFPFVAEKIPFVNADGTVDRLQVTLGVETCESQIDIYRLKAYLQKKIEEHANIDFVNRTKITHIAHLTDDLGYVVTTKDENNLVGSLRADAVVNCSWQNIERLDKQIGFNIPDEKRVNRVKVSIIVELPDSMKKMSSFMFVTGPYSSISVLSDGTGVITSEKFSNIDYWAAGQDILPFETQKSLEGLTLKTKKGQDLAKEILTDAASYLNEPMKRELNQANIKEFRVGYVKYMGKKPYTKNSIYKADSDIHTRRDTGIEEHDLNYFSCPAMKFIFAVPNARVIAQKMDEHFLIKKDLSELISQVRMRLLPEFIKNKAPETLLDSLLNITHRSYLLTQVAPQFFDIPNDPGMDMKLDGAENKWQAPSSNYRKNPTACIEQVTAKLKDALILRYAENRISTERLGKIVLFPREITETQKRIHKEIPIGSIRRNTSGDRVEGLEHEKNVRNVHISKLSNEMRKFPHESEHPISNPNEKRKSSEWEAFIKSDKNGIRQFAKNLKEVEAGTDKLCLLSSCKLDEKSKKSIELFFSNIWSGNSDELEIKWSRPRFKLGPNLIELQLNRKNSQNNTLLKQILESLSHTYNGIKKTEVGRTIESSINSLLELSAAKSYPFLNFFPNCTSIKNKTLAKGITDLLHCILELYCTTENSSSHDEIGEVKQIPVLDEVNSPDRKAQTIQHGS